MFIDPSIENIQKVLALNGNPQDSFKSILVGGTNGKGSTCAFLELLYLKLKPKLKIGKFSSPCLISVHECFSINGHNIHPKDFDKYWQEFIVNNPDTEILSPFQKDTFFAYKYFAEMAVDIAIVEVGMGGRWDATNTLHTEQLLATVITNISMDHMEYLGDTIDKIKKEKEGIIRVGLPHYNGYEIEASDSNPNARYGVNFLLACKIFEDLNSMHIPEAVKEDVLKAFPTRHLARLAYNAREKTLVDIAHNEASMTNLNFFIKDNFDANARKIFVIGMLDKDYRTCLARLFDGIINADLIICEPNDARKTYAEKLAQAVEEDLPGLQYKIIKEPRTAIDYAYKQKKSSDYLVITGTTKIMKDAIARSTKRNEAIQK